MSTQRAWPQRYRVVLSNAQGRSRRYTVVTWLTREKAVAVAVEAHIRRCEDTEAIHDVDVEDLGRAGRDAEGRVAVESGDLIDRMEF
jgi:hypothetical protein